MAFVLWRSWIIGGRCGECWDTRKDTSTNIWLQGYLWIKVVPGKSVGHVCLWIPSSRNINCKNRRPSVILRISKWWFDQIFSRTQYSWQKHSAREAESIVNHTLVEFEDAVEQLWRQRWRPDGDSLMEFSIGRDLHCLTNRGCYLKGIFRVMIGFVP